MSTTTTTVPTAAAGITAAAMSSFDGCSEPRLREIMRSLVEHLHEFITDVHLTEEEWQTAISILTVSTA